MLNSNQWKSGTALLLTLGMSVSATAPIVAPAPASAQTAFSDVSSNYWAVGFIQELSNRGVIKGFPDGTFRPNEPVTRAQFAAMVRQAFNAQKVRDPINFVDVPVDYWAYTAIQEAYSTGFMSGYPGNIFNPNQNIPRAQVLVSLSSGLQYAASNVDSSLQVYNDANDIPSYARTSIAAATERRIVVNYPSVQVLNPNQTATRAEVAAFIYQALVSRGDVAAISSPYIVGQAPQPSQQVRIPTGTVLPVKYEDAKRILVAKDEPNPVPLTVTVSQNVVNSRGQVLIPAGSQVSGEIKTVQGGAQFVAKELILSNGTRLPISASSEVITKTETIRKGASVGTIVKDTALGAAAAAAIAGVTGDRRIKAEEVLGGAGVGALLGVFLGKQSVDLIAIDPNTDLSLTLDNDLVLQ